MLCCSIWELWGKTTQQIGTGAGSSRCCLSHVFSQATADWATKAVLMVWTASPLQTESCVWSREQLTSSLRPCFSPWLGLLSLPGPLWLLWTSWSFSNYKASSHWWPWNTLLCLLGSHFPSLPKFQHSLLPWLICDIHQVTGCVTFCGIPPFTPPNPRGGETTLELCLNSELTGSMLHSRVLPCHSIVTVCTTSACSPACLSHECFAQSSTPSDWEDPRQWPAHRCSVHNDDYGKREGPDWKTICAKHTS